MINYREIVEAKELLKLPERASLEEIKASYRRLIKRWHPDANKQNVQECTEMTRKITEAYKIVMRYCNQYQYSFQDEEIKRYLSVEDWWFDRFGADPLWGKSRNK